MKKSSSKKSTKPSQYWDRKTFTWFIPAPPAKGKGHREKEFDKIMHGILQSGHEIIDWKTQSAGASGVYAIFLLGSTRKEAVGALLDLHERFALDDNAPDGEIEFTDDNDY